MRRIKRAGLCVAAAVAILVFSATSALAGTGFGGSPTGSFGSEGSAAGQFKKPSGIAINDSTGDVYVLDTANKRVEWFNSTGSKFEGQFNGSGAFEVGGKKESGTAAGGGGKPGEIPTGQFSFREDEEEGSGIAIDNDPSSPSVGDVYVDVQLFVGGARHDVIDKFSETGAYLEQLTGTCDKTGELPPSCPGFTSFERTAGVAVDPSGNLWVSQGDQEPAGKFYEFSDTGSFLKTFSVNASRRTYSTGIAVDSNGNIYVKGAFQIQKLDPATGDILAEFGEENAGALTIDPVTNGLFVDQKTSIIEYGPFGEPYGAPRKVFGAEGLTDGGGIGIAVSTAGVLYVVDASSDRVDMWVQGPTPAKPVTEAAKEITATTAVLHGELNPSTTKLKYYFEYNLGTSCTGGSKTSVEEGEGKVSQTVTGLEPNTQYTACFVAENQFGPEFGSAVPFTTSPVLPKVDSESASVKATEATLEAQVNPNKQETHAYLQYSASPGVEATGPHSGSLSTPTQVPPGAPGTDLGEGYGDQPVTPPALTGLTAGTTYYYQAVATNATGTIYGEVKEFATVPVPHTDAVTEIGATTATFNGELTPLNLTVSTEYFFYYNLGEESVCTQESATEPIESAGMGSGLKVLPPTPVSGLQPNHTYTVCLVSKNTFGEEVDTASPPKYFKTLAIPLEVIKGDEKAFAISSSEARFEALINPNNQPTKCEFQYGTEESLATSTTVPCEAETLNGFPEQGDGVTVGELEPATVYYYRVIAENEGAPHEKIEGKIERFSKTPIIESESDSALTSTTATLEATVNPDFQTTTYYFEYSTSKTLLEAGKGTKAGEGTLSAELAGTPVSVEISPLHPLQPGQTYYYYVVTENETTVKEGKPHAGTTEEFTPFAPPAVTTGEAQNVARTTATLSGTVDPEGSEATYQFEYISEAGYQAALAKGAARAGGNPYSEGETTAPVKLTLESAPYAGTEPQAVGPIPAAGLLPKTTYHYALVATNQFGAKATGSDRTFTTTSPTPPIVSTGGARNVSQNAATLSGTVATNSLKTNYGFEIGTGLGSYGPATGLGSLSGATSETVTLTLGELQPGTTYYYRVTATNADGTAQGAPQSFTTPGFPTLLTAPTSPPLIATPSIAFPKEEKGSGTTTSTKALTKAQKLSKALKVCHAKRGKKRAGCEKQARKKYAPKKAEKKK
jgi:hypothetical protein